MSDPAYCARCDVFVGLPGFHVLEVSERAAPQRVVVESAPVAVACLVCGVIAGSHGRRDVRLIDAPCFGRPVRLV